MPYYSFTHRNNVDYQPSWGLSLPSCFFALQITFFFPNRPRFGKTATTFSCSLGWEGRNSGQAREEKGRWSCRVLAIFCCKCDQKSLREEWKHHARRRLVRWFFFARRKHRYSQSLIVVLGHTDFSWTYCHGAIPLGHTKFSWSSGIGAPVEAPQEKSLQRAEKQEPQNDQKPQKKRKGPSPPKAVVPPFKVLCLHGYMQSGPIWEKKTSSFRYFVHYSFESRLHSEK